MVRIILLLFFVTPLFSYEVGERVVLSGKSSIQRGGIITYAGEYVVQQTKTENSTGIHVIQINDAWVSGNNMSYISSLHDYSLNQQLVECIAFASGISIFYAFSKGFSFTLGI